MNSGIEFGHGNQSKSVQYYLYCLFIFVIGRSINIYSLIPSIVDSAVFSLLAVIGGVLILQNVIAFLRKRDHLEYSVLLMAFVVIMGFASLLSMKYGIVGNIKEIVWSAIYFFVVYGFAVNDRLPKQFYARITQIFMWIYFAVTVGSLGMYLLQYSYFKPGNLETKTRIGFLESRLFGLYGDPNFAGMFCVIAIIIGVYLIVSHVKLFPRWFLYVNTVLQFLMMILTGSRSAMLLAEGLLALVVGIAVYFARRLDKLAALLRIVLGLIAAAVAFVVAHEAIDLIKLALQQLPPLFQAFQHRPAVDKGREIVSLQRADVADNGDISNMRFSIWGSAFDIFKQNWLFGVSPRNMVAFAKDHLPHSLIAMQGFKTHNAWIDVLASTGVTGILASVVFTVKKAIEVLQVPEFDRDFLKKQSTAEFLIVIGLVGFMFFVNIIFFTNDVCTFIFWLVLGKMTAQFTKQNQINL